MGFNSNKYGQYLSVSKGYIPSKEEMSKCLAC